MAKRLTSTGWLVRETIKGFPEASKKVGGVIGKTVGRIMKAPFKGAKAIGKSLKGIPPTLSPGEKKERQENLNKIKEAIEKYKARHPEFKVPKEFRDLE